MQICYSNSHKAINCMFRYEILIIFANDKLAFCILFITIHATDLNNINHFSFPLKIMERRTGLIFYTHHCFFIVHQWVRLWTALSEAITPIRWQNHLNYVHLFVLFETELHSGQRNIKINECTSKSRNYLEIAGNYFWFCFR